MTVGFFSPLPPASTGVADYSAALLRRLRQLGRVELQPARSDVNLYHLGNNHLHAAIYRQALRNPGVVVLHDAVLHHFHLGALRADEYAAEFVHNYGEWTRSLAESLWRTRARSAADQKYFAYPMLRRICETSRAVIVHNPAAAAMARRHASQAKIVEIPMLYEPVAIAPAADRERIRRQLRVPTGATLAGIFGHLRESKRILPVLRAFRRLPAGSAVLLLAGDSGSRDLDRAMQPFLSDAHVRRLPYTPAREFDTIAQAVDVCINLRYPTAGETSAISITFMGIGKPVLMTDSEEIGRIPQAACVRIPSGLGEEAAVEDTMRWLISMPRSGVEIGLRAHEHIIAHHSPNRVARLYWQTLEEARS